MTDNPNAQPTSQSDEALVNDVLEALRPIYATMSQKRDVARAILPILATREAAARAEGRREGIREVAAYIELGAIHDDPDNEKLAKRVRALAEKQP